MKCVNCRDVKWNDNNYFSGIYRIEHMGKRNGKKIKKQIEYESSTISQECMIEIQSEAYYRALKRIEYEKNETDKKESEKKKDKWYVNVLFTLNVIFWPWKINKRFRINNRIYDSILVLFVSMVLQFIGGITWLVGVIAPIFTIYLIIKIGITSDLIIVVPITIWSLFLGNIFILAGKEFGKETESGKIYAYSASVLAMISCIVSIIALIKW